MSIGYSGIERGERYDAAYFNRIKASNDALIDLRKQAATVQTLPTRLYDVQRLVDTGHLVVTLGRLICQEGDKNVYTEATYAVAEDSPIFRRVLGYAKQAIQVTQDPDKLDYELAEELMERVGRFCKPLGVSRLDVKEFARLCLECKQDKVEACVLTHPWQVA